jgi:subtilisin family serine protease
MRIVIQWLVQGVWLAAVGVLPAAAQAGEIAGQYLVVFERPSQARGLAEQVERGSGGRMMARFEHALAGGLFAMTQAQALRAARMPGVAYVEPDAEVWLEQGVQPDPPSYGLDRLDERALPLDGQYRFAFEGRGVSIFVIDSGIRASHIDFDGRARVGIDLVGDGRRGGDCNGHGTHVAGTAASETFGIAKRAQVIAVRVFGCRGLGSTSGLVSALDFVIGSREGPAVVNMSLGTFPSRALDDAVNATVRAGIFVAVAAGNRGGDACAGSPARAALAFSVAASDEGDRRARFSNFGPCVALFAPGVNIPSLSFLEDAGVRFLSGTSMAAPLVAGTAALLLEENPRRTPEQIAQLLLERATRGAILDAGAGSPNLLLFTPGGA